MTFVVDSQHSTLGPSSSERWMNCPGSVLLTQGMDDIDSWFAAEGTAAHTVSEWARVQNVSAHEFRGQKLKVGEHEFEVDDEMASGVDEFVQHVEQHPGVALYEVRVHYTSWVPGGFGTLDDGRLADEIARVTDFKYGKGVQIFARDNPQLKLYAAGLYHDFRWLFGSLDRFVLSVFQPRLDHNDEFEIKLKPLLEWMHDEVAPIASCALLPGAPLKAGDHCQFCRARRVCKTRADWVLKTVSGEFGELDAPQNLAVLTNDEIAKILPNIAGVKKWCADVQHQALSEIARGHAVGEWKVVEGKSNRAWAADPFDVQLACSEAGLPPETLYDEPTLKSVAQVEKLLGGKKKAASVLEGLVIKPRGKPTLAPGDDKRPALKVDVTEEFSNLDEGDE